MRDFLYDYPFAVSFLFLVSVAFGFLLNPLYFVFSVLLLFVSLYDFRVLLLLLLVCLISLSFYYYTSQSESKRYNNIGKFKGVIEKVSFGSHVNLIVKSNKFKVFLFAPLRYDNFHRGDKVLCFAKLKSLNTLKNRSFKKYLFSKGVNFIGFVRYMKKIGENKFISFIDRIRSKVEKEFYYLLPSSNAEYFLDSAFLGDSRFKSRIKKDFVDTQTAHIIVVSGVHMGFVFGMFYFVFYTIFSWISFLYKRFDLRILSSFFAVLPTLFYFVISGMHIPAIRSFIMILMFILSVIFSLRKNSFNILFFVGVIFLTFNYRFVFDPSFVMSFVMTYFAIFLYNVLSDLKTVARWLSFICLMSLFALPLSSYYFGKISVFSFLNNAVVVPLFGFVIMPVSFLLLFASTFPYGSFKVFLFKIASLLIVKFLKVIHSLAMTFGVLTVRMGILELFFSYIFLIAVVIFLSRLLRRQDI